MKAVALLLVAWAVLTGCDVPAAGDVDAAGDVGAGGAGGAAPSCLGETYARAACAGGAVWRCNPLKGGDGCVLNDGRVCVAVCP